MVELNLADQSRGACFSLYNALQIRPIVEDEKILEVAAYKLPC